MTSLPDDLDQAVNQAIAATKAAIDAGLTRLQVEIAIPELKVQPIAEQFVQGFADYGDRLRIFFPDAGAAALARRDWGPVSYAIRGIKDLKADILQEEELFIFVEPSAVEVQDVEKLCEQAGSRPVVFLNPCLEDVSIIGIGYAGRQLRERFLNTLESCYYLKPLEEAAIFRCFPGQWQVWVQQEGIYQPVAEFPQRPTAEILEQTFSPSASAEGTEQARPLQKGGLLSELQRFMRALSQ